MTNNRAGKNSKDSKRSIRRRLRRIEGQVKGIQNMLEKRECSEIIMQILAARNALTKVAYILVKENLRECITQVKEGRKTEEEIEDLLNDYIPFTK